MNEQLGYRVTSELKKDYDAFIQETYGYKRNKCGESLSKLMKFELALNGSPDYFDDPDVQELLRLSAEKYWSAHTQSKKDDSNDNSNEVDELKQEMREMRETLLQMRVQLEEQAQQASKKGRDIYRQMDSFVSAFQEEYGDFKQVSMKDISKLVIRVHGVCDKRSIANRVEYLMANGHIKVFAPNVYDILDPKTIGNMDSIVDHANQPRIDQIPKNNKLRNQSGLRMRIEDSFHITDSVNFSIVKDM